MATFPSARAIMVLLMLMVIILMLSIRMSEGTNVTLTSNLNAGDIAYDGQRVTFRCAIRGTGTILSWVSEEYIGTGGTALEFFAVHPPETTDPSPTNPNTVATLISSSTDATGVIEIVSELQITANIRHLTSSVSCRVNGGGTTNTINFSVISSNVHLTSNLNNDVSQGKVAFDGQRITFRCAIRSTGTILSWVSVDYIGTGGTALEFFSVHPPETTEPSPTNPNTVATLIATATDSNTRVNEIVSELRITASAQYPTSSVGCRVNGRGTENAINFRTIIRPTSATEEVETDSGVDSSNAVVDDDTGQDSTLDNAKRSSDVSKYTYVGIGVGVGVGIAVPLIILVLIIVFVLIVTRGKCSQGNHVKPEQNIYEPQKATDDRRSSDSGGSEMSKEEPDLARKDIVEEA